MFKKDVHAFPQRVVKNFNHLLVNERILSERFDRIGAVLSGQRERQRIAAWANSRAERTSSSPLRRPESHHDVFGMKNGFQPRPEHDGNIQRGKRPLAHDHGMNKLYGNVLRIGGVGATSEGKQPASREKSLRHRAASFSQPESFAREKLSTSWLRASNRSPT